MVTYTFLYNGKPAATGLSIHDVVKHVVAVKTEQEANRPTSVTRLGYWKVAVRRNKWEWVED